MKTFLIFVFTSFYCSFAFATQWTAELKINDKIIKNLTLKETDLFPPTVSPYEDGSGFEFYIDDSSLLCYFNIEYTSSPSEYNLIITISTIKPKKFLNHSMIKAQANKTYSAATGNYTCNITLNN